MLHELSINNGQEFYVKVFIYLSPPINNYGLQIANNVSSIYDVATEESNVPKGKGVSP